MKVVLAFIVGVLVIDVVHATLYPPARPFCIKLGEPMQLKDSK